MFCFTFRWILCFVFSDLTHITTFEHVNVLIVTLTVGMPAKLDDRYALVMFDIDRSFLYSWAIY